MLRTTAYNEKTGRSVILLLLSAAAVLAAPATKAVNAEIISRQDCVPPVHVEVEHDRKYSEAEVGVLRKANTVCGSGKQPSKRDLLDSGDLLDSSVFYKNSSLVDNAPVSHVELVPRAGKTGFSDRIGARAQFHCSEVRSATSGLDRSMIVGVKVVTMNVGDSTVHPVWSWSNIMNAEEFTAGYTQTKARSEAEAANNAKHTFCLLFRELEVYCSYTMQMPVGVG